MLVSKVSKLALYNGTPVRKDSYPGWPVSGSREQELLLEVLASGKWGGYHEFVGRFELLFAQMHDCAHGIAVANGTLAIELALTAAGIQPGDEVVVPAHSFISTASAVSRVGAVPVFVDIEEETFNIDPGQDRRRRIAQDKSSDRRSFRRTDGGRGPHRQGRRRARLDRDRRRRPRSRS